MARRRHLFARFVYRIYRLVSAVRHWEVRRFTLAGQAVVIGLILALAVGANLEQSIGYQAVMLLLTLILLSMLWAPFFRVGCRTRRNLPRFACIDEPFHYRVRVDNPTHKTVRGLDYLEDLEDPRPSFNEFLEHLQPNPHNRTFQLSAPLPGFHAAETRPTPLPAIPPQSHVDLDVRLTPLKRGPLHFRGTTLARTDPLGLFRGFVRQNDMQTLLVLPRRYPLPPLNLPGSTRYQHGGVSMASGIGESEEFVALREYRRGDSLRRIHWRSWARINKPIVKEYQDEFFVRHALVLDTFGDITLDPVFEEAVSVAASFAWTIPDQESLLDLMFVGTQAVCATTGRGVGQMERMLEILSAVKPCRENRFESLRQMVQQHAPALSGCILVLLQWDASRRRLVHQLKTMNVPCHAIVILRPGEKETFDRGPAQDQPDRLILLELGKIGEGLAAL